MKLRCEIGLTSIVISLTCCGHANQVKDYDTLLILTPSMIELMMGIKISLVIGTSDLVIVVVVPIAQGYLIASIRSACSTICIVPDATMMLW